MYEEDRILAEQCTRFATETGVATEWLRRNREMVRGLEGHEKELRKAGRLFRSCAVAAKRTMCAGVFGPSQAGKSYLVSTLAGNADGKLWTVLGPETYDFLSQINPAGGKESTGLVTRFTLTRPATPPEGFPVQVRLLSVTDVVKILANTYFSDAEHMDAPDREAMLTTLSALEGRKRAAPTGGLDQDDVEDLQEYIHKYFRGKPRIQQLLDQHFWDRVIPLAPLLEDNDRAELFAIIWDGIAPFTALLREMFNALRSLDFPPEVFCGVNALIPREGSIIDVATLGTLSPNREDVLEVHTPAGKRVFLPRVFVTALTAELIIPMRDKPADFFDHTDLLDFPGYRSRKMFVDMARETQEPAKLKECFLRGKVAYLFQRYCAERELTSLLLCIGSGVQEVQGLGGAVNDWIAGTHGNAPELRQGKENALFFILTKSDMEFEEKAGAKDVSERWDTRIFSSTEIFSGAEWLKNWTPDKTFDNLFLMRNPTVKLHLFEHDANGRETALKEDMKGYVSQFEQSFKNSAMVGRHFALRDATWKAFITPDDGGLSLIREKLAPICKPELKREQIRTILQETLSRLRDRLTPYWRTDDKEEERKQKAILGQGLAKLILGMLKTRRFGQFMRLLTVRDQAIYDLYFQAQYQMRAELAAHASPVGADADTASSDASVDDLLADLLGEEAIVVNEPQPSQAAQAPQARGMAGPADEAQAFANHIEKYWLDRMRQYAEDPVVQRYFGFAETSFSQLIHELSLGFLRLGARKEMEEALRQASLYANVEKERSMWKQASLATMSINTFVDWLGFDPRLKSEQERTISFSSKPRTLFSPPPPVRDLPAITDAPADYADKAVMDWAVALIHLVNENVNFDSDRDFNPEENRKLGATISVFVL